jgi:hypothetical protein
VRLEDRQVAFRAHRESRGRRCTTTQ